MEFQDSVILTRISDVPVVLPASIGGLTAAPVQQLELLVFQWSDRPLLAVGLLGTWSWRSERSG